MDWILALYGFRSKQEFIYRTNRMKEIAGASELIAGLFRRFLNQCELPLSKDWEGREWRGIPVGCSGVVVYEGGGNLCLLFENRDIYLKFNQLFSLYVVRNAPNLGLVAAGVAFTDDFSEDMRGLRRAFDEVKRVGSNTQICNVLPYSKVDRLTFQPLVDSRAIGEGGIELSRESLLKREAYNRRAREEPSWAIEGKDIDGLGDEKGRDSLIAVIYCDGNSIGESLKRVKSVDDMRAFSVGVHKALVENPLMRIRASLDGFEVDGRRHFRTIVDHGDEITIVANAHAVPVILDAYFDAIEETGSYHACAGVAVCHAHDPFSEVYRIAEECCESAKGKNRETVLAGGLPASYVDFHFCRAGITGSLRQIRTAQEAPYTLRPYVYKSQSGIDFVSFLQMGRALAASVVSRSDIKNLGNLVLAGPSCNLAEGSFYKLEIDRLKFKEGKTDASIEALEKLAGDDAAKLLFDISSFFDVWFGDSAFRAKSEGGVCE